MASDPKPPPKRGANGTGRNLNKQGYVVIYVPPEERELVASWGGQYTEHRYVMAKHLGRPLLSSESVHHKNGERTDNRIENLELWNSSHLRGQRVEDLVKFANEILALYGTGKTTLAHCATCTCFEP